MSNQNSSKELDELDYLLIEAEFGIRKGDTTEDGELIVNKSGIRYAIDKFLDTHKAKNTKSLIKNLIAQQVAEAEREARHKSAFSFHLDDEIVGADGIKYKLVPVDQPQQVAEAVDIFAKDMRGWDIDFMVEDDEDNRTPSEILLGCIEKSRKYTLEALKKEKD